MQERIKNRKLHIWEKNYPINAGKLKKINDVGILPSPIKYDEKSKKTSDMNENITNSQQERP